MQDSLSVMTMSFPIFNIASSNLIDVSGTSHSSIQNEVPCGPSYSQRGALNNSGL